MELHYQGISYFMHTMKLEWNVKFPVPDSSFVTHESQAWHFMLISDLNCTQEMSLFL